MINRKKITKLLTAISLLTAIGFTTTNVQVQAASKAVPGTNYKLKIAGKAQYKRCLGIKVNGKSVSSYAPSFSRASTSMYSAYYVYSKNKALGVTYSYSSKNKTITLKRGSKKITMYCEKTYAYVNGKKTKLPTPARRVYSYSRKKNYIYVPGYFTAKNLGLTYSWSSSSQSGNFKTPSTSTASNTGGANTRVKASSSKYSIRIKKPSGLGNGAFTTTDDYGNRRLRIKVKGNYKNYFATKGNYTIKTDKYFRSYSVTYSSGYTYIYIRPRKDVIKAYAVSETSSYIYIYYDSPTKIYNRIVVMDAGHGGSDSGATGNGYVEKTMTLKIVLAAKSYFDKNSNYKVYYTRTSDTYPSLSERSALANNVDADRFISVHINSASASATGTETLYNSSGYKSSSGLKSYTWSNKIHGYVKSATKFKNRGLVNRPGLAVLRNTKTASTLTEIGFISNKTQAKTMNKNLTVYGKAIYNGIINSFSSYPSKR
ncbi:MAG: N-acetylmuramoyl-L-alanine amidase [Anaerostipes sp.]|nr:N-acetylmuramoyl-L-alanine amidase [Anaerostipes sp.]